MNLSVLLLFLFSICRAQNSKINVITQDLNAGQLDPLDGSISCVEPLSMPPTQPGCEWKLALGRRGQTSTVFYANQTRFLVGQEICANGEVVQSILFQESGPWCSSQVVSMRSLYKIDPTVKIEDINLCWDHACNVVVLQPEYGTVTITFHTEQVSEYDAQVRPQPNYLVELVDCDNCWRKVTGLGALDAGIWISSGNAEWNCGDTCVFYSLEEKIKQGKVTPPRAFIGRYYRSGILAVNITDSLQAQTLSWNPFNARLQNQFLGIGICCTAQWCHPDCRNLDSHLVLFSFNPMDRQFSVLSDISDILDPDTIRLGVEFSAQYDLTKPKQAYIYHQQTVLTYDLTDTNGFITAATLAHQSPKSVQPLAMWAAVGFFFGDVIQ